MFEAIGMLKRYNDETFGCRSNYSLEVFLSNCCFDTMHTRKRKKRSVGELDITSV